MKMRRSHHTHETERETEFLHDLLMHTVEAWSNQNPMAFGRKYQVMYIPPVLKNVAFSLNDLANIAPSAFVQAICLCLIGDLNEVNLKKAKRLRKRVLKQAFFRDQKPQLWRTLVQKLDKQPI